MPPGGAALHYGLLPGQAAGGPAVYQGTTPHPDQAHPPGLWLRGGVHQVSHRGARHSQTEGIRLNSLDISNIYRKFIQSLEKYKYMQ